MTGKDICFICGAKVFKSLIEVKVTARDTGSLPATVNLLKCTVCGIVFADTLSEAYAVNISDLYSKEYFQNEYMKFYADAGSCQSNEPFEWRLNIIEKYLSPGKMLDIGCAAGEFLLSAKKHGWNIAGIEISKYAADIARSKGVLIAGAAIETASIAVNSFDCVSCGDVLEHQLRPDEFLKKVHAILKPGGIAYIAAPNFNSLYYWLMVQAAKFTKKNYFVLPHHLFQFTPDTLQRLVRAAGFTIEKMVLSQPRLNERGVKRIAFELISLIARIIGWKDRVICIARKI